MDTRVKLPDEMQELLQGWAAENMPGYDDQTPLEAIILRLHATDAAWRAKYPDVGGELNAEVHKSFGWPS